jgi:hypothetical protein
MKERQALVDSLARLLGQIGLQRQARPVKSLEEHIRENYGDGKAPNDDPVEKEDGGESAAGANGKEVDDANEK